MIYLLPKGFKTDHGESRKQAYNDFLQVKNFHLALFNLQIISGITRDVLDCYVP